MGEQVARPVATVGEGGELSVEERGRIHLALDHGPEVCDCTGYAPETGYVGAAVCDQFADAIREIERIVADREAATEARVREEIAAEIEADPGPDPSPALPAWWSGWAEEQHAAARIARGQS